MIGMRGQSGFFADRIRKRARQGTFKSLAHAGAAIRMSARRSIKRAPKDRTRDKQGRFKSGGKTSPSRPGSPPHTRAGALKSAILYAVESERMRVVIGPVFSIVGKSGAAHEHGGRFRGRRYPPRPFMGPALKQNLKRLPRFWRGSVK
jgi:hypothetical protein